MPRQPEAPMLLPWKLLHARAAETPPPRFGRNSGKPSASLSPCASLSPFSSSPLPSPSPYLPLSSLQPQRHGRQQEVPGSPSSQDSSRSTPLAAARARSGRIPSSRVRFSLSVPPQPSVAAEPAASRWPSAPWHGSARARDAACPCPRPPVAMPGGPRGLQAAQLRRAPKPSTRRPNAPLPRGYPSHATRSA